MPAKYPAQPDYSVLDPMLEHWSDGLNVHWIRMFRDDVCRSFWLENKVSGMTVQVWIDSLDLEGYCAVNAAERRPDLPSQWGKSLKYRIKPMELESRLEEAWLAAHTWIDLAVPSAKSRPQADVMTVFEKIVSGFRRG